MVVTVGWSRMMGGVEWGDLVFYCIVGMVQDTRVCVWCGLLWMEEEGTVSGIIDWEAVFFYPRFYITLKPEISAGFYLEPAFEGQIRAERWAWGELLQTALIAEGFEYSEDHVRWYKSRMR